MPQHFTDYIKSLIGKPEDLRPITALTDRIAKSTRAGG